MTEMKDRYPEYDESDYELTSNNIISCKIYDNFNKNNLYSLNGTTFKIKTTLLKIGKIFNY